MDPIKILQGWIGMIGVVALGNTISCYRGHEFLSDKLYTVSHNEVNPLMARLFGIWTLLSAVLRIYCSANIRNKGLYNVTFVSFLLAFLHFVSEVFIYKSAAITVGVVLPLVISGVSMLLMGVGYIYIYKEENMSNNDYDERRTAFKKKIVHSRLKQH